jgi:hypothetical protein
MRSVGSFYTQVLVRGADEHRCAEVMRGLRRASYVIPPRNGITVVCDRQSEAQDLEVLDSVAATLSARLHADTTAVLNHDDHWLVFRHFHKGAFAGGLQVGRSPLSLRGSIARLRETVNPRAPSLPLYLALLRPRRFQVRRHADLIAALGAPERSLGVGYNYIASNDVPGFFNRAGIIET